MRYDVGTEAGGECRSDEATTLSHLLSLLCFFPPSFLISHHTHHFTQLEDTLASFWRSLSFCWWEPQRDSVALVLMSVLTQRKVGFGEFCFSAICILVLTRLLALIFLVSTLFSEVIFLMFSWASFSLLKNKYSFQLQVFKDLISKLYFQPRPKLGLHTASNCKS